jgi:hypothetical protein
MCRRHSLLKILRPVESPAHPGRHAHADEDCLSFTHHFRFPVTAEHGLDPPTIFACQFHAAIASETLLHIDAFSTLTRPVSRSFLRQATHAEAILPLLNKKVCWQTHWQTSISLCPC